MNSGRGTTFWQSKWLGNQGLVDVYSKAFAAAFNKNCCVAEIMNWNGNGLSWNLEAELDINGSSFLLDKDELLEQLHQFSFGNGEEDVYKWKVSGDG